MQVDQQLIAVVVDEILRSQQIVIKPLKNGLYAQKGWLGSCVLGDGLPALILSPIEMLDKRYVVGLGELNSEVSA